MCHSMGPDLKQILLIPRPDAGEVRKGVKIEAAERIEASVVASELNTVT